MRADTRRTIVAPTGGQRCVIEGIDGGAILGKDRDMKRLVQPAFTADPEIRLAAGAKALYISPALTALFAVRLRPSSSGPGHRPFTAETRVRFP